MITKYLLVALFGLVLLPMVAKADYIGDATTTLDSVLTDIGTILFDAIPTAFGLFAALIGLFFIIRLIRKYIGRGK